MAQNDCYLSFKAFKLFILIRLLHFLDRANHVEVPNQNGVITAVGICCLADVPCFVSHPGSENFSAVATWGIS